MKKLLLLLSILAFSFGAFAGAADLWDAPRTTGDEVIDVVEDQTDANTSGSTQESDDKKDGG